MKTSLNACRSTIIQQETEIKRLTEALSIRERRILQLETQVKTSADVIASRNVESLADNSMTNIDTKLTLLTQRIDALTMSTSSSPSNNIYINNNGSAPKSMNDKQSQTEDNRIELHCEKCGKTFKTEPDLQTPTRYHTTCPTCRHERPDFACDFCGLLCPTETDLQDHIENKHVMEEHDNMATSPAIPGHPSSQIRPSTTEYNL